jgi:hypothetical protein
MCVAARAVARAGWNRTVGRLRHHSHHAELVEMLIEGRCRRDAEPLHHDTAYAVGEAPPFVPIGGEDPPGVGHNGLAYPFEMATSPLKMAGPISRAR